MVKRTEYHANDAPKRLYRSGENKVIVEYAGTSVVEGAIEYNICD